MNEIDERLAGEIIHAGYQLIKERVKAQAYEECPNKMEGNHTCINSGLCHNKRILLILWENHCTLN